MRGWGFAAVGTLAVALTLALAGPTAAAVKHVGGLRYVTKSIAIKPADAYKRAKAGCPGGTHVFGGGGASNLGSGVDIYQSYPVDGPDPGSAPDDGWGVLLRNLESEKQKVKLFAVCARHKARYGIERSVADASSQTGEIDVGCTSGKAVGGGVSGPRRIAMNSGGTLEDGFGFYLDNQGELVDDVAGYVICAKVPTTLVSTLNVPIAAGATASDSGKCPGGTHVYSGGQFNTGGYNSLRAEQLRPLKAKHPDRGWIGGLASYSAIGLSFTVNVVCGPSSL
jgi:hypothetical protein